MAFSHPPESPAATLHLDGLPAVMLPEEAFRYLRVGRSKGYELIRTGQLFAAKVGRGYRVPRRAVERFLSEPAEAAPVPNPGLRLAG